jgi:hypothetical protein
MSNWEIIGGSVLILVGGWYVPFLRSLYIAGFKAMLSEAVLKKVFLSVAEKLVKSSKNKLDDVWFAQMKKNL